MTTKGRKPVMSLYDGMVEDPSIEYPDTDGEPMAEDEEQLFSMIDTISSLQEWFADREDVHVGGDLLFYYRMNDNETRVAPDVFVTFGSDKGRRRHWRVWTEGRAPDFVMEMASGSTWRRDMRQKRDIYALLDVTEYWRFDPGRSFFTPPLVGERLVDGEYTPLPTATDEEGLLRGHSEVLGLDLCVLPGGELRFHDRESGRWLRTLREESMERDAADRARQAEATARQAAEAALEQETAARQALEEEVLRLRQQLNSEG